jgi:hypothetical protein
MTRHVMLHSALGDSIVAFRSVIEFSKIHEKDKINLIYNRDIDDFMKYWVWPNNITLMPLQQTCHDFDNTNSFPYHCDDQGIVDAFVKRHPMRYSYDYRPALLTPVQENNLKEIVPNKAPLLFGLNDYIVLHPISSSQWAKEDGEPIDRCPDEDKEKYQKFLLNLIDELLLYTKNSIAIVGDYKDVETLPALKAISSNQRCFNLMGHLSIDELCDTVRYCEAVFGLSSSCVHMGNYIFDKPVISWRTREPFTDLFDNFLNKEKCENIGKPWEKDNKFYIDFLNKE